MKLFPSSQPKPLSRPRKVFLSAMAVVMAAAFGYQFWQTRPVANADPSATSSDARVVLAQAVARHMPLPSVLPSVDRITDPTLVRSLNPAFYAHAETGDWVLRYPSEVILYRATTDEVVKVMAIKQD